ncbi:hypothetical protein Hanom_Chr17g01585981 [Helianthus anomalus]
MGVPKMSANLVVDKQMRKKKAHVMVTLPPMVPKAAGTFHPRLRKYEDYVVVSDTLEGLSVPGGSWGVSGATAGTKPVDDKKRKGDATVAGGEKAPMFRKTRVTAVPKQKPTGSAEPLEELVPKSTIPSSPLKVVDVEVKKKGGEDPTIEVVSSEGTPSAVRGEQVSKETWGDTIFDMLDSSNNLIDPCGEGDKGARSQSPLCMRRYPILLPLERELKINLQFSRMSLNWIIIITLILKCVALQSTVPPGVRSLAKLLSDERKLWKEACARENEKLFHVRQELSNLKAANAALVKEKTVAEVAIKEAERHGATTLKEAEARAAKELADANDDRTKLNKVVEEVQAELKSRVSILEEVTSRVGAYFVRLPLCEYPNKRTEPVGSGPKLHQTHRILGSASRDTEAETRARQAEEARDGLATSLAHVTDNHAWMRKHGIGHIVETILDAPENATAVTDMTEHASWAGFKAGYNKCLNNVNPFCGGKFTEERSRFHGVDTEAAFVAAVDAYNKLSIPALDRIETCLESEDYMDRLCMLFNPVKEGGGISGANAE